MQGKYDVSVGITLSCVMYANISAHSGIDENLLCEFASEGGVLPLRKFNRQEDFFMDDTLLACVVVTLVLIYAVNEAAVHFCIGV
ncbi:MAG: hypothetical protein LBC96_08485 [Lachnospiraceae bacterium]|nr:hypothetical protein [Lachnospiraceae bacterium]